MQFHRDTWFTESKSSVVIYRLLRFPDDSGRNVLRDISQTPNCHQCSHSSLLSAAEMNKAASFDYARFASKQLTNMQLLSSSTEYIYKGLEYYAAKLVISLLILII